MALQRYLTLALLLAGGGCGGQPGGGSPGGSPVGLAVSTPLLQPFQGSWVFDPDRTLAAWEAQGLAAEEIERARSFSFGHEPLEITDNIAVGSEVGMPETEYYFFSLHTCEGSVCGKAWHHEDRHDPGDMSKCHVKLRAEGDEFHFDLHMQEEPIDLDDPDLTGAPPVVADGSGGDDMPPATGPDRGGWTTYVFVRSNPSSADASR